MNLVGNEDTASQSVSEDTALPAVFDPDYSETPYSQLRILLHEDKDFIKIVKMLKLCDNTSNLAAIVVDYILPISDTVIDHLLKDPILTEIVSITRIVKGGSISNVRTQIKNYIQSKDNQRRIKSKGAL